jgi:DNA-binding FrmR family transcriptional regulator
MTHTIRDKVKLLRRVRRIVGQLEAVQRGLEAQQDSSDIMLVVSAAHGALNSLMAELVEGHVRHHMVDPDRRPTSAEAKAAQELIDVVKAYVR